ncbi:MAG: SNF2 helicase associated domain-containing protein [Parachlamydiaceae bacterium]|nr:SNF2 helicase associated domain-containing protein [Parachlamydiaceae bacterium]
MLNFRRLRQDYSPVIVKEGRLLHDKGMVVSSKVVNLTPHSIRLSCRVLGSFDNTYTCEIEIDRKQSTTIDADCACSYKYDCQHLSAVLFFLEENLDQILVTYSKETDLDASPVLDDKSKAKVRETLKEAHTKEVARQGKKQQKELLQEYLGASKVLAQSPYFVSDEQIGQDQAELAIVFNLQPQPAGAPYTPIDLQLALRLPYRSKPLHILNARSFLEAVRYQEPLYIGGKRFFFTLDSFDPVGSQLLKMIIDLCHYPDCSKDEKQQRFAQIEPETLGIILSRAHNCAVAAQGHSKDLDHDNLIMPFFYCGSLEQPLRYSHSPAQICVAIEYLQVPAPKILLNPTLKLDQTINIMLEEAHLFECATPGMIYQNTYYNFFPLIRRKHLRNLAFLRDVTIPEPLFGTFIENSLPELMRLGEVTNQDLIERFVTLPFVGTLTAECEISYLNGELEAALTFIYDNIKVPAAPSKTTVENILPFVTNQGILARNLAEEQRIIDALFQDFILDSSQGLYVTKTDKKIVEFMTEVIPKHQDRITFHCPENLLDQFLYDDTTFELYLKETDRIDRYEVQMKVNGHLNGVTIDLLWECLSSRKTFIELVRKKASKKKGSVEESSRSQKILVLDLERLAPIVHVFDELGIKELSDHREERPLWSLANIDPSQFENLPVKFTMTARLQEIQQQMLGTLPFNSSKIPAEIKATLRPYQVEGISWLERLRHMHLNGILADDMGLGKTLQAIIAITQHRNANKGAQYLVICPTSLVYNWQEEVAKFNPRLKALPVDGTPTQRKKLLNNINDFDVIITSYSLLQKDIDFYKTIPFAYAILDEAQHIKNRETRNAKSVKMLQASHKLILTGTPIENSLDELWSLFDFLMPGLLSSYDRFLEKYVRSPSRGQTKNLEDLRRKVSPFILRRMKKDVIADLPPVSHIVYHCHLSETQRQLYHSYAASAREELSQLVKKEGFDKVQIHVLATLTRLKQICCHPAIFAKEHPENEDSAKYDMLMELLQTLIEGKHKTVIFSQYTRMLNIMRQDLEQKGIPFEYLDGTSKNRLGIVKKFNEDPNIPVFLVSLKAGGSGLNLVGADTVIHYDMWWNPAVENQATDRVHRIGQKNSVSSYKLITLNTVEEKILELQRRKSTLVTQLVTTDEEAIAKLTWEEVLEILQT